MSFSINADQMVRQNRNTKCLMSRPAACSAEISAIPTSMVNLKMKAMKNQENYLATIRALPDTRASVNCIEENFAKKQSGDTPRYNKHDRTHQYQGQGNECSGKHVKIIVNGGKCITTVTLVCPRLTHQMLLSWITQKKLQMLHQGWPFCVINTANTASISEFNTTPKRFRPKESHPDPQIP